MEKRVVFVNLSFKITGRGIVAEIQHNENGLAKGTLLVSENRGLAWEIKARVLHEHCFDIHQIFENEQYEYVYSSFSSVANFEQSRSNILEKEKKHVFQYYLKPISHEEKPDEGEILLIQN